MPRPPLPLGTWGTIRRSEVSDSKWVARTRFRDFDGHVRIVEAFGSSGAAAERALMRSLNERSRSSGGDTVTRELRMSKLCALWLEEIQAEERVKPQTIDRYVGIVTFSILPAFGELRVGEVTVSAVDRFLKVYAARHPTQAQSIKQVLGQIMSLAVRHDAIMINPVRNVSRLRTVKKEIRALSEAELDVIRAAVRQWRQADESGRRPVGPSPSGDLPDIIDVFLATGLRINEVLAIRWEELDLEAARPTLTVTGTLVQLAGIGIIRQESTKSSAGRRRVFLPAFAVEVLLRRQANPRASNELDAVFTTRNGTWVSAHNVRRQWRDIRKGIDLEWVTPHAFRKTVATMIEREADAKGAAAQLGHASETVTDNYYIVKTHEAPDFSRILEKFAPKDPPDAGDAPD